MLHPSFILLIAFVVMILIIVVVGTTSILDLLAIVPFMTTTNPTLRLALALDFGRLNIH
jgi:hypothetical protein